MNKSFPWNLDAFRHFDGTQTEDYLLVNKPIKEFLERDDKFFLIGAKGLGKTLFLRYKSYLLHEKHGEEIKYNVTRNELTENLNIHPATLSKEELLQFENQSLWQLIWELSLWIVIFREFKEPVHPRLEKLVGGGKELSPVLTRLLNNRGRIDEYREFVNDFLERKNKIKSSVAVFVDDVDQTLHDFLLNPHPTDEYFEGRRSPSVAVWVNAQMGLIGAIYNMNRQNSHVKIYATIRREAFEAYTGEMKMNYMQHASMLQYDKDEIKTIFEKNIQLVDPGQFFGKTDDSWISQFLSFDQLLHRFAVDLKGNRRSESAFDFIYRHTYGRPREIILMGKAIDELVSSAAYQKEEPDERVEKVRSVVNGLSNELLRQYIEEIIPYLNEEKLQEFVEQVHSNVITKEDQMRLDQDVFRQLFNLGLIGYARPVNLSGAMRIVFNPPATYNYRRYEPLPDTNYFVTHSTMDTRLLERHTYGHFYNRFNIIGNGYDFFPNTNNHIRRLEFYLPHDVTGNRLVSANEAAGHRFPLQEIYRNFFNFQDIPRRHEKFSMHWNTAGSVLGLVGRICYCNLLVKKFKKESYIKKQEEYFKKLDHYHFMRQYNAELSDPKSEQALDRFSDKLIGRYITLGCYLVLDMRIEWIHQLLRHGHFSFSRFKNDAAFPYLTRSFFIRGLQKEEPRNPHNHLHRQQKQRIYNLLSSYEQESLRSFIRNASDEVHFLDWIEDQEHKHWLTTEVLPNLWLPE